MSHCLGMYVCIFDMKLSNSIIFRNIFDVEKQNTSRCQVQADVKFLLDFQNSDCLAYIKSTGPPGQLSRKCTGPEWNSLVAGQRVSG